MSTGSFHRSKRTTTDLPPSPALFTEKALLAYVNRCFSRGDNDPRVATAAAAAAAVPESPAMATSVCDPSTPEPTEFSDAADELRARFRAFQEQAHAKSQEEEEEEEEKAGKNTTNANKPSKKAPHKTRAKQHAKSTKKNKKRTPAATARARKRAGPDPAGATPARKRRRKQDLVDLGRFREYLATVPAEEFARLQDVFITDFGARRSLRQEQQPQKDEAEGGTRNEYYASALCKFAAENHNVSVRGIADENKCNGKYVDKNRRLPDATYVYVGRKNPRFPHAEPDAVFSPFLHAVS